MKSVLIIGGNGFIGTNLAEYLCYCKYKVTSFDINEPTRRINSVKYIIGDFFDDKVLDYLADEAEIVIHALSTINPSNSEQYFIRGYEKDFLQTVKLCELIQKKKRKLIFLSSGGTVYGQQVNQPIKEDASRNPINHYANIKVCIENTIKVFGQQKGMKYLILRLANPYGRGQDYKKGVGFINAVIRAALGDEYVEIWGDGEIVRDYISISDVVRVIECFIRADINSSEINIGSGKGVSQNEIVSIVSKQGLDVKTLYLPCRKIDLRRVVLDNSKMLQYIDFELQDIESGIAKYIQEIKEEKRGNK